MRRADDLAVMVRAVVAQGALIAGGSPCGGASSRGVAPFRQHPGSLDHDAPLFNLRAHVLCEPLGRHEQDLCTQCMKPVLHVLRIEQLLDLRAETGNDGPGRTGWEDHAVPDRALVTGESRFGNGWPVGHARRAVFRWENE